MTQAVKAIETSIDGPLVGRVLDGAYRLEALIGKGGMGHVYRAQQLALDRTVAVKLIRPDALDDATIAARFRAEVRAVQQLMHPNTVRVYDFGETEDDLLYLVMELLNGVNLDDLVNSSGPLPQEDVVEIGAQVLKSLMEAHGHGVIHRDIKPANLMLCSQVGLATHVKVLDFGLARVQSRAAANVTRTQDIIGTPAYMSPEQLRNKACEPSSDLYGLGMTLYELATGECLYVGDTAFEVAMQHLSSDEARLPSRLRRSILGEVIARAVRKRAEDRYPSAKVMLRELTGEMLTGSRPSIRALRVEPSGQGQDFLVSKVGSGRARASQPTMTTPGTPTDWPSSARVEEGLLSRLEQRTTVEDLAVSEDWPSLRHWWQRPSLVALSVVAVIASVLLALRGEDPEDEAASAPRPPASETIAAEPASPSIAPVSEQATPPIVEASGVRLELISNPPGALVLLDGSKLCTTPCEVVRPRETRGQGLRIQRPGFETSETTVTLTADRVVSRDLIPLEQAMPAEEAPAHVATEDSSTRESRSSRRAGGRRRAEERSSDDEGETEGEGTALDQDGTLIPLF